MIWYKYKGSPPRVAAVTMATTGRRRSSRVDYSRLVWYGGLPARQTLYWFAFVTMLVHLASAVAQVTLSYTSVEMDYVWTADPVNGTAFPDVVPMQERVFAANVGFFVAAFSLLSAAAQLVFVANFDAFWRQIRYGVLTVFWVEYSLSASLMISLIAQLSGAQNAWVHIHLFLHFFVMNMLGLLIDLNRVALRRPRDGKGHASWNTVGKGMFVLGSVQFLACFVTIGWYFLRATETGSPPAFVYVAVLGLFALMLPFPVIMYLDHTGRISKPAAVFWYIASSLAAKTVLSWDVFGGVLARS
jgi:hypothetical protein